MQQIPHRQDRCYDLADDGCNGGAHHAPFEDEDKNGINNAVDDRPRQRGDHGKARAAVRADDGVHGLAEHIEWDPQCDIEEVFLRVVEGLCVDCAAEQGDDVVGEEQIRRCQHKAAGDDQHHRIADAAFCTVLVVSAQRHADKGTAAVSYHNGDGQCNHRQRKNDCVGCIAIRAKVACIGNKDLIHNIIQCAHQQRDHAGDGVLPHEPANTLCPQKRISGIHKNAPFFQKTNA